MLTAGLCLLSKSGVHLTEVVQILGPIFALIFVGYICVSRGFLQPSDVSGLGKFVIRIALPSTIFLGVTSRDLSELVQPIFFAIYGFSSLAIYFFSLAVFKYVLKDGLTGSSIKGLGSSFSNSGFIGLPLLLQFFDNPPMAAFAMVVLFENLVMMPLGLIMLEYGNRDRTKTSQQVLTAICSQLVKSPLIMAIAFGALAVVSGLQLPSLASDSLGIAAKATAGAGLIYIGGTIASAELIGRYRDMLIVASFKLVLFPLLVSLALLVGLGSTLNPQLSTSLVLFAAAPMITVYPIIGSKFGYATFCSATLVVTTGLSLITLSCVLLLI
jgi:malonate transporter